MTVSRATERQRIFIAGRLTFAGGVMSVACNVRDLSDHGARVAVDPGTTLPSRMTLEIASRNLTREVELRWRHGDVAGVEFLGAASTAANTSDPEARIRQLEEENARLRKQLRDVRAELANRIARDEASN
ncbi:MAG: PilZ domain-containing protein [Rhodoblastus sp.]|nr:MAG: PilZ domain-containing protein [Rhodoblastus sp.]